MMSQKKKAHDPGSYDPDKMRAAGKIAKSRQEAKRRASFDEKIAADALKVEGALVSMGADMEPTEILAADLGRVVDLKTIALQNALSRLATEGRLQAQRIGARSNSPLEWRLRLYHKPTEGEKKLCRDSVGAVSPRETKRSKKADE